MNNDLSEAKLRKDCPHCDLSSFAYSNRLEEDHNFTILSDAHPLTKGHILIIPKQHLASLADYPAGLLDEFYSHLKNVNRFIEINFGTPAYFEHGIFGQTVFHSHIHVMPFDGGIADIIPEGKNFLREIPELAVLPDEVKTNGGYLLINIRNINYLADKKLAAPRFFRDRFAKALQKEERANWKEMRNNHLLMETVTAEKNQVAELWKRFRS